MHCSEPHQTNQAHTSCRASSENSTCTDKKWRADRHHLLDAMLKKVFGVTGRLGTAGSACPQVLLSVKTWRHQPNTSSLFVTLSCISIFLPGCCTLGGTPAVCMLMMVGLHDMHDVSSGLASCRRCNAVAVGANGLSALCICCSVAQAA